mmetsp:Transcript_13363/g.20885  ORF Transcript_13363/g.20885 Transcript_13363/m.20885 type:complete len:83 (-) Transcript_13363:3567-3815(-)
MYQRKEGILTLEDLPLMQEESFQSWKLRKWTSILISCIVSIILVLWTIDLVKARKARKKKKQERKEPEETKREESPFNFLKM